MRAKSALKFRIAATLRAALNIVTALPVALALGQAASAQPAHDLPPLVNLQHTLQVRKALWKDKELAALNIGVKVENRIATLWGPMPSSKLITKAVLTARAVPDVLEVRCLLFVGESEPPEPKYLPPPDTSWKAPPPPMQPAVKSGAPEPAKTTAVVKASGNWQPASIEKHDSFKATPVETQTQADDQALFVLPAIAVPFTSGGNTAFPELPLSSSLKDRVLQLKGNDWRFYYLQITVEENRVYVNGSVYNWADLQQMTKAISRVPGVENVIIGQVQLKALK